MSVITTNFMNQDIFVGYASSFSQGLSIPVTQINSHTLKKWGFFLGVSLQQTLTGFCKKSSITDMIETTTGYPHGPNYYT